MDTILIYYFYYLDYIVTIVVTVIFLLFFAFVLYNAKIHVIYFRNKYEKKIQKYYKNNNPRTYLINEHCESCLFTSENKIPTYFYVKERGYNQVGRYFEVKTNDTAHVCTMWAIFDMEFNDSTTYTKLKKLYESLNSLNKFDGDLYEHRKNKLPTPIYGKNARVQNEYCRMEIQTFANKERAIICSEIWGTPNFRRLRKFIIKANENILHEIIKEFACRENKLENYSELRKRYSNRNDCEVVNLDEFLKKNIKEESKIQETPQEINAEQIEKENQIEKFNERNIDL